MLAAADRAGVTAPGRPRVPVGARPGAGRARHRRRADRRAPPGHVRAVRAARRRSRGARARLVVRRGRGGGGWLGASGSHLVDQVRTWLGEIVSVSAALPTVARRSRRRGFVRRTDVGARRRGGDAPADGGIVDAERRGGHGGRGQRRHARARGRRGVVVGPVRPPAARRCPTTSRSPRRRGASDDPRHRYTHLELGPYTRLCEALRAGTEGRPYERSRSSADVRRRARRHAGDRRDPRLGRGRRRGAGRQRVAGRSMA